MKSNSKKFDFGSVRVLIFFAENGITFDRVFCNGHRQILVLVARILFIEHKNLVSEERRKQERREV